MKKFLLSTLLFIGGILGSIQAEGPVFQWAKSLDGNPGNGGDRKNGPFGKFVERNCRDGAGVAGAGKLVEDKSRNDDPFAAYQF